MIVISERDKILELSSRNVKEVKVLPAQGINVFDVLKYDKLVMTTDAIKVVEKALS